MTKKKNGSDRDLTTPNADVQHLEVSPIPDSYEESQETVQVASHLGGSLVHAVTSAIRSESQDVRDGVRTAELQKLQERVDRLQSQLLDLYERKKEAFEAENWLSCVALDAQISAAKPVLLSNMIDMGVDKEVADRVIAFLESQHNFDIEYQTG